MARLLEHALQHVQLHRQGTTEQAKVFCDAAEDIRRLLHQFAAGFLKESDGAIRQALEAIIQTEFPAPTIDSIGDVLDDDLIAPDDEELVIQMPAEVAQVEAPVLATVEVEAPAALVISAAP